MDTFESWLVAVIMDCHDLCRKIEGPWFTGGSWTVESLLRLPGGATQLVVYVYDEELDESGNLKPIPEELVLARSNGYVEYKHVVTFGALEQVR